MSFFISNVLLANPCGKEESRWQDCQTSKDCMSFSNMCGFKTAYNKKYLAEIDQYNRCMGPKISCVNMENDENKNVKGTRCVAGKCQLSIAKVLKPEQPEALPRKCSTDDQCVLANISQCCTPDAINRKYLENFQTKIKDKLRQCASVNCVQVMMKAICRNEQCTAVLQ